MFGGSRATSATLGSSEEENKPLLSAVIFRTWDTYIISITQVLAINLEQKKKSNLSSCYLSFHISIGRGTRERY